MNRRLREHARASRPDLVLVLKGESLEAETVDCLQRAARKRLVTWWLDDPFGSRLSPEAIRFYHTWFLFDRSYFERLARAGAAESVFLPCCCDPDIFRPLGLKPAYDVTFVGVYYPQRGAALEQLRGFNVGVWGPLWDGTEAQRVLNHLGTNWRGKFADQKTAVKIHNASRICLNVHHPQTRLGGLNLRTFEVLASGASLLTDYIAGMDELLVPGEEVACYSSPDQVRPQVDYYLAHPDERLRISQRGRARVLREHTYHHRMKTILDKLGLGDE